MSLIRQDTIAAIATAPVPAGVAIIRVSGPEAITAALKLCPNLSEFKPRFAHFTQFQHGVEMIDEGLAIAFPAPNSFTGEDVVEIQGHGGPAVTKALLEALFTLGVRQAEAGEFSRRAVVNGKLDLTAAEGLADLIAAQTEAQRRQAQRQLQGELAVRFEDWRVKLLELAAQTEAGIDFPDEELEVLAEAAIYAKLSDICGHLTTALQQKTGQRLREGFEIVVLGKPNAGKSTLTNLLTGRETAIVSPIAGTTRDVVEAQLDIAGFPVKLADTAGLRETTDIIEAEGVKRATGRLKAADCVIGVVSADEWPTLESNIQSALSDRPGLIVISKVDTVSDGLDTTALKLDTKQVPILPLNLTDPQSITPLLNTLAELLQENYASAQEAAQLTRQRHVICTQQALEHLERGLALFDNPPPTGICELLAQDLRDAARAIGEVTGRTTNEDVLDLVFSSFCIGK